MGRGTTPMLNPSPAMCAVQSVMCLCEHGLNIGEVLWPYVNQHYRFDFLPVVVEFRTFLTQNEYDLDKSMQARQVCACKQNRIFFLGSELRATSVHVSLYSISRRVYLLLSK